MRGQSPNSGQTPKPAAMSQKQVGLEPPTSGREVVVYMGRNGFVAPPSNLGITEAETSFGCCFWDFKLRPTVSEAGLPKSLKQDENSYARTYTITYPKPPVPRANWPLNSISTPLTDHVRGDGPWNGLDQNQMRAPKKTRRKFLGPSSHCFENPHTLNPLRVTCPWQAKRRPRIGLAPETEAYRPAPCLNAQGEYDCHT